MAITNGIGAITGILSPYIVIIDCFSIVFQSLTVFRFRLVL